VLVISDFYTLYTRILSEIIKEDSASPFPNVRNVYNVIFGQISWKYKIIW
jgi:hypothetical protein